MRAYVSALAFLTALSASSPQSSPSVQLAQSTTCFKTGENAPTGSLYKDCFYNCLGSQVTISIPSYAVCPVTIKR